MVFASVVASHRYHHCWYCHSPVLSNCQGPMEWVSYDPPFDCTQVSCHDKPIPYSSIVAMCITPWGRMFGNSRFCRRRRAFTASVVSVATTDQRLPAICFPLHGSLDLTHSRFLHASQVPISLNTCHERRMRELTSCMCSTWTATCRTHGLRSLLGARLCSLKPFFASFTAGASSSVLGTLESLSR